MLFNNCESCNDVAMRACGCEDPPRFFCDSHITNHILSSGEHSIRAAVETLSAPEVSSLRDSYNSHRLSSLRKAIQEKNSRIESLLLKIRRAEEECSVIIKEILTGQIAKDINQVLFYRALPLFSESSVVRSLLDLKHTPNFSDFSSLQTHQTLISLNSSFNSSLLSSFPSLFSIQHFPFQMNIMKAVDPKSRWELLEEKQAHSKEIFSIAVSDCEKYIASASQDKTINVWSLETLALLCTLNGHTKQVFSVAFLGDKIVSGSADTTIKIWEEDRCVNTLNKHSSSVTSVSVSSYKRLIVSGSTDKTAVVFRSQDNQTVHSLKHSYQVQSVAFSPDDKEIASGSGQYGTDGFISIWSTETGQLLKTLNAHSGVVTCVKFSENYIASSSKDKSVKVWYRDNEQPLLTFTDHFDEVCEVEIRGNAVASLGQDNKLIIRDIRSGSVIQTLRANGESIYGYYKVGLKLLNLGKFIVSGARDKYINVWRRYD